MSTGSGRQYSGSEDFWGEIPPSEHLVQIYEDDGVILEALEGFVSSGLWVGDCVLVIATAAHLRALEARLMAQDVDVWAARGRDQYIPLDAEDALSQFLVKGWPDAELFEQLVSGLLTRARRNGRRVRAFGEMVALLWGQGHNGATVRLEHLWHRLCQSGGLLSFLRLSEDRVHAGRRGVDPGNLRTAFRSDCCVAIRQILKKFSGLTTRGLHVSPAVQHA